MGATDALRRGRVPAVRAGRHSLGPAGRPVGSPSDDAGLLLWHGRGRPARRRDAERMANGDRADAARHVRIDLPPGRNPDAAANDEASGLDDRRQRAFRKHGHCARGIVDRTCRQVPRLARGVCDSRPVRHRLRHPVRAHHAGGNARASQARLAQCDHPGIRRRARLPGHDDRGRDRRPAVQFHDQRQSRIAQGAHGRDRHGPGRARTADGGRVCGGVAGAGRGRMAARPLFAEADLRRDPGAAAAVVPAGRARGRAGISTRCRSCS